MINTDLEMLKNFIRRVEYEYDPSELATLRDAAQDAKFAFQRLETTVLTLERQVGK